MKLKDLLKGLFPDKSGEIDQLEEEAAAAREPNAGGGENGAESKELSEAKNLVKAVVAENKKLLDELTEIRNREKEREKLLNDKAQEEKKNKIESAIKKAVDEKKIAAKDEQTIARYRKLLEADYENTEQIINSLPVIAGGDKERHEKEPPGNQSNNKQNENQFKVNRRALVDEIRSSMNSMKN